LPLRFLPDRPTFARNNRELAVAPASFLVDKVIDEEPERCITSSDTLRIGDYPELIGKREGEYALGLLPPRLVCMKNRLSSFPAEDIMKAPVNEVDGARPQISLALLGFREHAVKNNYSLVQIVFRLVLA